MKVTIILYSGTGNTRGVAERLVVEYRVGGRKAGIREITVTGDRDKRADDFRLATTPPMDDADLVVITHHATPLLVRS